MMILAHALGGTCSLQVKLSVLKRKVDLTALQETFDSLDVETAG